MNTLNNENNYMLNKIQDNYRNNFNSRERNLYQSTNSY
jgi:hypothetical protein